MSEMGQSRQFDAALLTSGLPRIVLQNLAGFDFGS